MKKQDEGFTLIELLIVIVILGILAAVVVFAVNGITDRGQSTACSTDERTVRTAAEAAFAEDGAYPATEALLVSSGFLSAESGYYDYSGSQSGGVGTTYDGFSVTAVVGGGC